MHRQHRGEAFLCIGSVQHSLASCTLTAIEKRKPGWTGAPIATVLGSTGWHLPRRRTPGTVMPPRRTFTHPPNMLADALTASEVLKQGQGFCNPKATLLVALMRAAGIPARMHMVRP